MRGGAVGEGVVCLKHIDNYLSVLGMYAAVNEPDTNTYSVPSVHHSDNLVIAVFSYEAQGDQELNLEEGDIITIISKEDDVWWSGRIGERSGMFPVAYVEPYHGPEGTS